MRLLVALLPLAILLAAPAAHAQPAEPDVRIVLPESGAPTVEGEGVRAAEHAEGEQYAFEVNLTQAYTVVEVRAGPGLGLERARQLVPHLLIPQGEAWCGVVRGACDYPLFEHVPTPDVHDVDHPVRIANVTGSAADLRLRLGIPGPVNATLLLVRDVEPPVFVLRPVANLTPIGFYQETVTEELALGNLQVRREGTQAWIDNPTTLYHYLQRYPVQGLDGNRTYETRVVFTDWAGNQATSPVRLVTTPPEPEKPIPLVQAESPAPNATVGREGVVLRATYESPGSPVPRPGVRLFFDLQEVTDGLFVGADEVTYEPGPLAPGRHTVSVEVTNEAGGRGVARWTFVVEEARAPAAPVAALLGALALLAVLRRR